MTISTTLVQRRRMLRWLAATSGSLALYGCGGGGDADDVLSGVAAPRQDSFAVIGPSTRYRLTVITFAGLAAALNESGQATGVTAQGHPFLYSGGKLTDLGTLSGGYTSGSDINDHGQVAGTGESADRRPHAFLYSDGTLKDLDVLVCVGGSEADGINNLGQVTGGAIFPDGAAHAFVYTNGRMIDIGSLGGFSKGHDINDAGQVTGESTLDPAGGPAHAFLYSDGVMIDLGTLGGQMSTGYAINAHGQVTGQSYTASTHLHAFLYADGRMLDLGSMADGGLSVGRGINASGWVVGVTDFTGQVGFVYDGARMHDLNALLESSGDGWVVEDALDINDMGQIVAVASQGRGGPSAAVLLSPVGN